MSENQRDHGGGLDAACARFGGMRLAWADLSTGINPHPYPFSPASGESWAALPDSNATTRLSEAARHFWRVPDSSDVLVTAGLSSVIAQIPALASPGRVSIPGPTYNEHAASFTAHGWEVTNGIEADARVIVHPNNPDGHLWSLDDFSAAPTRLTIIDESFCDTCPEYSLIAAAGTPGTLVLKSFGKFWGLAGLRLGFVMGQSELLKPLREKLGPWPVSGPALAIGAQALADTDWAERTRQRLRRNSIRLDDLFGKVGAVSVGGTTLFRLYEVEHAEAWQEKLAAHRIWSRVFPYNSRWLRVGLPHETHWPRLETALQ